MINIIESSLLCNFGIDKKYPNAAALLDNILKPLKPLNPVSGRIAKRLSGDPELDQIRKNIKDQYEIVNTAKAKKVNDLTSVTTMAIGIGGGVGLGLGTGDTPLSKMILGTGGFIYGMYAGFLANRPVELVARTALDVFTKRKQQRDIQDFLESEGIR